MNVLTGALGAAAGFALGYVGASMQDQRLAVAVDDAVIDGSGAQAPGDPGLTILLSRPAPVIDLDNPPDQLPASTIFAFDGACYATFSDADEVAMMMQDAPPDQVAMMLAYSASPPPGVPTTIKAVSCGTGLDDVVFDNPMASW